MKTINLFLIACFFAFTASSCSILTSDDDKSSEDFRFVVGELLLDLEDGHTSDELDSLLADYELEQRGSFFPGYRILVPENEEKKWAEQLEKEEIIHSTHLNRFGYGYKLVEDDGLPYIKNDSLYVWTVYSGCSGGHDFTLQYTRTGSSSFEVWLFKENGEDCFAVVGDKNRLFKIPDEIKNAQSITLIQPINDHIELKN
jgi:hypothetical protein